MEMTHEQLLAMIDERVAADPVFAADVAERRDALVAAALSVGRVRPREYLITIRGLRTVLGKVEGRVFVEALREAAALVETLPTAHPAYDDLWWLRELLPALDANGGAGIDIGSAETRTALEGLVILGELLGLQHRVTTAHVAALVAASSDSDPIDVAAVSASLNQRAKENA